MNTTWIVVASREEVRVFSKESRVAPLVLEMDVGNPAGRLRNRDIESDRPGRATDNRMRARHAYSTEEEARDRLLKAFYTEIFEVIRQSFITHRFQSLVLVAEPRLLGILRSLLPDILSGTVEREIPKDLSEESPQEIASRV